LGDGLCNDRISISLQKISHGGIIVAVIYENITIRLKCSTGWISAEGNGSQPYKITLPDRIVTAG